MGRRKSQSQGLLGPQDRSLRVHLVLKWLHLDGRQNRTLPATNPLLPVTRRNEETGTDWDFECPAATPLLRTSASKRCGTCSQRPQCTSAAFRSLIIHRYESARQRARELANTPEFATAQRQRKKVEALFAELKNQIGLRRLRLRRLKFVREQFFLAAVAQNIKRLVRFLSQPTTPTLEAAT